MPNRESMGELYDDRDPAAAGHEPTMPRPIGTPLSMGGKNRAPLPDGRRFAASAGSGRSLPPQPTAPPPAAPAQEPAAPATPQAEDSGLNSLQRALQGFKLALPLVQKLLPLIDGNVASAVSSLFQPPPPQTASVPPPAPGPQPRPLTPVSAPVHQQITVDLTPIEEGLKRVQNGQRELHVQIAEQNTSIKRVEDQLEMVREATDRNTLEQQELMEDLKGIGKKVNIVTLVMLAMLLGSLLLNLILYLHMQRVLP